VNAGEAVRVGTRVIDSSAVQQIENRLLRALAAFHRAQPAESGMPRAAARAESDRGDDTDVFDQVAARLTERGALTGSDRLALTTHRPSNSDDDRIALDRLESLLRDAHLAPPDSAALAQSARLSVGETDRLMQRLVRDHRAVRVDTLIFHPAALD